MQQPNKTQGGGRATKPAVSKKATSSMRAASTPSSKKAAPRSLRQTAAARNDADGRVADARLKKDNNVSSRNGTRFDGGTLKNRSGAGGTTQPGQPVNKEGSTKTQGRNAKSAVAKGAAAKGSNGAAQASKSAKGTSAKSSKSSK